MWRLQYQINGEWQCHSADLLLFVASKYSVISLAQSRWYFFFFFHKTPFIFYPRTLSTPTSHPKSINIRKLSDISCSVQWTSNTFFNTFLNLESSQIKVWKLCVNVIFSLAFQNCLPEAPESKVRVFFLPWTLEWHETKVPDCYCAG